MRVTIDSSGSEVSAWISALREASRGEEIRSFESGMMENILGSSWLDFAIRGTNVFHASSATPCAPRHAKLTATVGDLSCWLLPESHTATELMAAHRHAERILEPAHGLIAVSEAARQEAIRVLNIRPERITTIYPGVDAAFFDAKPTSRDRPYVLCAGGSDPRGHFQTLVAAWEEVKPELRRNYDLITTDNAPSASLPGLVAGATLFAHLSSHESFPTSVAQAMAAHVAVLIPETSGMPEVGRDAGIMVDPHSVPAIAEGLTRLLESEPERAKLARYGRARAEKYRWEKCSVESLAFFHRVLGA